MKSQALKSSHGKNLGVKKPNSGRTNHRRSLVYIQEIDIRVNYSKVIRQLIVKKQSIITVILLLDGERLQMI